MIGRIEELAGVRSAIETSDHDAISLVLVGGEAGVGKTRLVREAGRWAAGQGYAVADGACLPLGLTMPYAPFVDVLGVELFDRPDADRLAMFRRAADALIERAGEGRLVVVMEDLHWADASTCDFLVFCGRVLAAAPVWLIGTYRTEDAGTPLGSLLAELGSESWLRRVELSPLTERETAEQVAGIRGAEPSPDLVSRVYARSAGNPFFAEELLAADPVAETLPHTVRSTVLTRLGRLDDDARRLAQLLAVAESWTSRQLLLAAADIAPDRVDAGIQTLLASALVVADRNGYAFRHALAQEVVRDDVGPAARAELHRRLAELLTEHRALAIDASPAIAAAERAYHWEAAGEPARALTEAVAAAESADSALAPAETQAQVERALRLWDQVPDPHSVAGVDRIGLLEWAGRAALEAGRFEEAAKHLGSARASLDPEQEPHRLAEVLVQLWRAARNLGQIDERARLMDEAAQLLPAEPPSATLAIVLAQQAEHQIAQRRYERAAALARRAVDVAEATGNTEAEGLARVGLGFAIEGIHGDEDEAIGELRHGLDLMSASRDLRRRALAAYYTATTLRSANRFEEAATLARGAYDELSRLGADPSHLNWLRLAQAQALHRLGKLREADALLTREEDWPGLVGVIRRISLAELSIVRGNLELAREVFDQLVRDPGASEGQFIGPLKSLTMELRAAERRWDDARRALVELLEAAEEGHDETDFRDCASGMRLLADRREAGHEDGSSADLVANLLVALQVQNGIEAGRSRPRPEAACNTALAHADAARARGMDDPALWRTAVAAADATVERWPQAYARYRLAVALLTSDTASSEGADVIAAARDLTTEVGAEALGAEIAAAAERFRLGPASEPDRQDPLARFGLTARESEVLALVAGGATNRQIGQALFISDKTASVHVRNILRKLDVKSRTQAAAVAFRAGLEPRRPAAPV